MKKSILKKIALLCAVIFAFSLVGCGDNSKAYSGPTLPDYGNDKQFEFFAYRAPSDGKYIIDGVEYQGESQKTPEGYKLYKDSGMTMLFLNGGYDGSVAFNESATKADMDIAYAAGLDRIIFRDGRITTLATSGSEIFAGDIKDETQLKEYVKECLSEYYQHPAFYGLSIGDEPPHECTVSYGITYKAVKSAAEELGMDYIYLHINFLPIDAGAFNSRFPLKDADGNDIKDFKTRYTQYIEDYIVATGADRISVDIYIFRGTGIYPGSYANLQILQNLCKKHGVKLTFCLQSFEAWNGTTEIYSKVDKSMMRMELEMLIGFGCDHFAYYTYTSESGNSSGDASINGSAFITLQGEPTEIYYYAQDVMSDAKQFQNVVLNYEWQGSKFYASKVASFDNTPYFTSRVETLSNTAIEWDNSHEFKLLKELTLDNDIAFVSELYDDTNDLYMYMVQNCIDPRFGKVGDTSETIKVTFDSSYKYVAEFDCGKLTYKELNNGVYEKTLSAGYSVYLIPLK